MLTSNAIILNIADAGEYDQFASLYTQKFGKIVVRVKSARKVTTKQGNFLHTPGVYECSFVLGRGGYILSGIQDAQIYSGINSNLAILGYVTAFLNLVDSVAYEGQKDSKIWDLLVHILKDADKSLYTEQIDHKDLWHKEKLWIVEFLKILGLKPQKLKLEKSKNPKDLDLYLKKVLENKLEQPVYFFGLKM